MEYPKLVLHVDDDPAILRLVANELERAGISVISISDPMLAMDEIKRSGVRVVLLDIDMPKKDGLTLLREIKLKDAGIQVIMCTGMVSISTVLRSTSLGAEGLVFKPLRDLSKVTDAVNLAFTKIDRWWNALREWREMNESSLCTTVSDTPPALSGQTIGSASR